MAQGKDTKMAWPLLCTYLRGRPRNWNPYLTIRMLPRLGVCIAVMSDKEMPIFGFPLLLKSNYSKTDFRGLFGKCEIIS